jgi:hypothetical protein
MREGYNGNARLSILIQINTLVCKHFHVVVFMQFVCCSVLWQKRFADSSAIKKFYTIDLFFNKKMMKIAV